MIPNVVFTCFGRVCKITWLPAPAQTVLDLLHFPYYDVHTLILAQAWIPGYVCAPVFW